MAIEKKSTLAFSQRDSQTEIKRWIRKFIARTERLYQIREIVPVWYIPISIRGNDERLFEVL
jgi:hypothetical protein